MKKIIVSFLLVMSVLTFAVKAFAVPSGCYTSYQGQNCGIGNNVMLGLNCAPDTHVNDPHASSKASWDLYCDALPRGSGVSCLSTAYNAVWNAAYCACDTGYAGATCTSCAGGYTMFGTNCIKETALIYDADKDTIVTVEQNPDEDKIRFIAEGIEYGILDPDYDYGIWTDKFESTGLGADASKIVRNIYVAENLSDQAGSKITGLNFTSLDTFFGTDIILNGGLEDWTGANPDNWDVLDAEGTNGTFTKETTIKRSGTSSGKFVVVAGDFKAIQQLRIGLTATDNYKLSSWSYGTGAREAVVLNNVLATATECYNPAISEWVDIANFDACVLESDALDNTWQEFNLFFFVPVSNQVAVIFTTSDVGNPTNYIDDITLQKITEPPSKLTGIKFAGRYDKHIMALGQDLKIGIESLGYGRGKDIYLSAGYGKGQNTSGGDLYIWPGSKFETGDGADGKMYLALKPGTDVKLGQVLIGTKTPIGDALTVGSTVGINTTGSSADTLSARMINSPGTGFNSSAIRGEAVNSTGGTGKYRSALAGTYDNSMAGSDIGVGLIFGKDGSQQFDHSILAYNQDLKITAKTLSPGAGKDILFQAGDGVDVDMPGGNFYFTVGDGIAGNADGGSFQIDLGSKMGTGLLGHFVLSQNEIDFLKITTDGNLSTLMMASATNTAGEPVFKLTSANEITTGNLFEISDNLAAPVKKFQIGAKGGMFAGNDSILARADVSDARSISSQYRTGYASSSSIGMFAEARGGIAHGGVGILGVGKTYKSITARSGTGVRGEGLVNHTDDDANATGVTGLATSVHVGGKNIGVSGTATDGSENWSFYGYAGDIGNLGKLLVGASPIGLVTDFPTAKAVVSQADTGNAETMNFGLVGEAASDVNNFSAGLYGVAKTSSTKAAYGVLGRGVVNHTDDEYVAVGVSGVSTVAHAGARNIAILAYASESTVGNFSFYSTSGDLYNLGTGLFGSIADKAYHPNAKVIATKSTVGDSIYNNVAGIVGLATAAIYEGNGVHGIGRTAGGLHAYGVKGRGVVTADIDTANSVGVYGIANMAHSGGVNIGVYGLAAAGGENFAVYSAGNIFIDALTIFQPSADIEIPVDGDITVTKTIMRVIGAASAAATNVGFVDGTKDGQMVIVQGTHDSWTVIITDNRNCQLAGGVDMTLGNGDTITLIWDAGRSNWYETGRANN